MRLGFTYLFFVMSILTAHSCEKSVIDNILIRTLYNLTSISWCLDIHISIFSPYYYQIIYFFQEHYLTFL